MANGDTGKDYYEILGVSKDADKSEIKRAYRTLAKEKHPDRNKSENAEAEFREVQEAYEVLSDENKRKAYDQFGKAGVSGFGGAGAGGGFGGSGFSGFGQGGFSGGGFGGASAEDLSDIFEQFFGNGFGGFSTGGARRDASTRGADIEATLRISFDEAVFGKYKTLSYKRYETCDQCDGVGAKSASAVKTCETCRGSGRVTKVRQSSLGTIQTAETCGTCGGSGKIITDKCSKCQGEGRVEIDEEFKLKIPPGIPDGVTLKFRDRGNAGKRGGNSGDLYVSIEVQADEELERRGDDIYSELTIPLATAVLGGEEEIRTVRGEVTIKIPAGTTDGKVLRLSEKGGPRFRGNGNGDHYVKINLEVPQRLTKKQRKLWEQLDELKDDKPGIFG
ncbi:MAG: molecular chaperone DnaJ [Candidatus Dojkabacteria bacterium]